MSRRITALSALLLLAAWTVDMLTPQRLVAAILLAVPVAVAALYLRPNASRWFILAALFADGAAGWFNAAREGWHWDAVSVGNRLLVALSIVLVGVLGSIARAALEETGRLNGQQSSFDEIARKNEELVALNASLADRGTVIRDIVYALSHDLRTPLAAASMTLQQALEGRYGPLPEAYQDIVRRSLESNRELGRLAETLLLVARYESGEQSKFRRPIEIAALSSSVVAELEPLCSAKHIQIGVDITGPAVVMGDEAELRRAMVNLLANAIKATPDEGTIHLQVSARDRRLVVAVEDSGYGLREDQLAGLFQRMPEADRPSPGAGTGLGLYIARRIAEQHGGSISYEQRQPHGSTFSLELPLAVAEIT